MKLTNVTLLIADGTPDATGDVIHLGEVVAPYYPIPVFKGNEREGQIGWAKAHINGKRVLVDLDLDEPEDPDLLLLTPSMAGCYIERGTELPRVVIIQAVQLCRDNCDKRIGPLSESIPTAQGAQ